MFAFTLTRHFQIIRPNLIIAKVCQNKLNYTADICDDLNNHTDVQTEVTKHVTDYEALYSTISFVPKYDHDFMIASADHMMSPLSPGSSMLCWQAPGLTLMGGGP